jgi:hypothetical protein
LSDAVGLDGVLVTLKIQQKATGSDKSVRRTQSGLHLHYNHFVAEAKPFRLTESVKAAG